jgi:hypothetical protein
LKNQYPADHSGMGKYPTNHPVPCPENYNAEHYHWETERLRPQNKTKRALWEYDNIIKSLYF